MPTTSVEIRLGERRRSFHAKVLLEPEIAQKCELSNESAIHHFHGASKTSSQDATFFAGWYRTSEMHPRLTFFGS
jgi:hypothetical protein